ncbi:MAG: N-acetylneuraminate synthase family protein [Phycisphaerales bacterium]|jgi:N-acetylneuraminate synthase/N,N'-diacetyllegionaminate synthase|nr:N-acetylneuraminate synthase family protein [Phycisphaerales bacterium]
MLIGTREIGPNQPVYVIAELGVNHDGRVDRALELTQAAARAGADAVKLQYFEADRLMSRGSRLAAYQARAGERDPIEMLRRLELSLEDMSRVIDRAHTLGLHAIVTVFSVELVAPAAELAWDAFKSASPDLVHRPLLQAMTSAPGARPLIVSTGAATREEVVRSVGWLHAHADRLAMLQCVSCYPTLDEDAAIDAMHDLRGVFAGPVGYSDHTPGVRTGAVARARGATILEKHLTWDRSARGPDHAASLDEPMLRAYITAARACAVGGDVPDEDLCMLGDGVKRVLACERDVREASRQSIRAARDLRAGEVIQLSDLAFARPGNGLEPWRADELVGRTLARDVSAHAALREDHATGMRPSGRAA